MNRENMDFQDTEDVVAVKAGELSFADGAAELKVSGPHFSRVSSLQVLVETNAEDTEKTALSQLSVLGFIIPQYV